MVKIVREQTFYIQSSMFVQVSTILQKKNQKGSEKNRKNLVRQMIQTTNVWNEKKLDANLKITTLKSFQSQIKITRNGECNYIFSKRVSRASYKECNNGQHNKDQYIYVFIACVSDNYKYSGGNFGDSS